MNTEVIDLRWRDLYRIAGIAAVISEIIILLGFVTYFIWPFCRARKPQKISCSSCKETSWVG